MNSKATVDIVCRVCESKNRIPVERALKDLSAVICGKCKVGMLRVNGEPLLDVEDRVLAHKWDVEALEKLKSIPLLDTVLSKIMGSTLDQITRFRHLSEAVKVSDRQAPRLWKLYLEAAGRINVDPPPLYIVQNPGMNAYTAGASEPIVAVTSGLLEAMDDRAICGVLGHELTHVRLGHVLYRQLAIMLAQGALKALSFLGLANLAFKPLQVALFRWYQMSELSADRGELITTGNLETYIRTHMMLAGGGHRWSSELDVGAFVEQAHEAEDMRSENILVALMEMLTDSNRTHPAVVWRVHHGLKWAQSQEFFDALAGAPPKLLTA